MQTKISEDPVLIIGGGPAGYKFALELRRKLSEQSIVLVEQDRLGGTCLHRGCIPSKQLWSVPDLGSYQSILYKNLKILEKGIESELLRAKVQIIKARASLDGDQVIVDSKSIKYSHLVIASGSKPRSLTGFEAALNSDSIFENLHYPQYCFIGGSYVGLELASALAFHGKQVRVLEMQDQVLSFIEPSLQSKAIQDLQSQGIQIQTSVQSIQLQEHEIPVLAIGRELQCNLPKPSSNIHIIGDANQSMPLAHAAYSQARVLAYSLVGEEFSPGLMPYVLFLNTELAWIGLNSNQAKAQFGESNIDEIVINWASNAKARISHAERGLTQWIIHRKTQEILGCHIWGVNATDLISIAIPILNQRLTVRDMERMIFPHPTIGEVFAF